MFDKVLTTIFGSKHERDVKAMLPKVALINGLEPQISALTDDQLREKTIEFRQRLRPTVEALDNVRKEVPVDELALKGAKEELKEALEAILPEAFAVCREAAKRVLNMRHFDVQLMGGMVLHIGRIAEMKTGEGKTLVATLPVYLNALTGRGVHLVTVNDYLARRDAEWMGRVYRFLGLTVGVIQNHHGDRERQEAYRSDVTYGTNNEYGFDYLRDNMKFDLEAMVQRDHVFAIVDEVDSILIDEARTPLIISGPSEESVDQYYKVDRIVPRFIAEKDFQIDEKQHTAVLTEEGVLHAEKLLGVDNLYDPANMDMLHHVNQALRAHTLYKNDVEYVVKDGEVLIVDEFTGRLMPGRRWSDGLHQAVEAKEGVKIEAENQTLATITFQNYFRIYRKLAGMTGTAVTEAEEFSKIYNLEVVVIPTHQEMIREDFPDVIYKTEEAKYRAVVEEIAERHATSQPVLLGTTDIAKSERISRMLEKRGVAHSVLNAKYHEKEAEIVEDAGQPNTVTIATNMAGRGTDIKLGEGVVALGGLHIIGTERHESRRIDNQLRGRCGRQGDPGSTRFFISLEDELMRIFGSNMERVGRLMEEDVPLESRLVSRSIESAQSKVEGYNFDARRHVVEYDDVMNTQRQIIYGERRRILEGVDTRSNVLGFIRDMIADTVPGYCDARHKDLWDLPGLFEHLGQIIPLPHFEAVDRDALGNSPEAVIDAVYDIVEQAYEALEKEVGSEALRYMERWTMLHVIDQRWVAYLTTMEHLKEAIGLQGYAQKDPLVEYKNEAFSAFEQLKRDIQFEIATTIFRVRLEPASPPPVEAPANLQTSGPGDTPATGVAGALGAGMPSPAPAGNGANSQPSPVRAGVAAGTAEAARGGATAAAIGNRPGKVGRNDPCPCGSGKKYKRCHGR